jgi:hypothetical protein
VPPDTPFRPRRILEILARHRVQHVVIGAYAAVLVGAEVLTRDLDITPGLEPSNLQRLAEALQELHAAIRVPNEPPVPLPTDGRLLARAEIWNLTTDAGDLDISVRPDGTNGYEDLRRAAHRQPLDDDLYTMVAALQDIIRSKTAAGRAKDLAALPALHATLERQREQAQSTATTNRQPPKA